MSLKKMMYATVALVTSWAGPAVAVSVPVYGPICDISTRVSSTTYYSCSGSSHTALDMGNGTCSEWNHRGMLGGSFYYVYFGGCANSCTGDGGCNGGAGNYVRVAGSNGWDWRQLHINSNATSGSKTCDRCALGLVGATGSATHAHVHADNRQYGTRSTAWYTGYGTTCGSSAYCGDIIGYATL
ncbi:peptidase M23 [Archangium sp.]|uniref:peptidase M23 n=1 Tax=Archangium sp. TaxID=1872627 RepID=UPI002D7229C1|nr:peptidase M23 [Archangium sp.]HYO54045.1 peptidase M23 [Archangium sp.]